MGPVAEYVKSDATGFGAAVGDIVNAVKGEGVGAHVLDELIAAFTSSARAMNEIKAVPEAAAEHIVSGLTERMGDQALAEALAAEQALEAGGGV